MASGAVESVAETLTDAFVAPVPLFLVFGLLGALLPIAREHGGARCSAGDRDVALE